MPEAGPLLIILFVILVVVMIIVGAVQARRRREELAAWAGAHGLSFERARDKTIDDRWPDFRCLREGSNRYGENIIRGDWGGRALMAFDYHYETYSTDNKGRRQTHHHHFSAVILESPLRLKPLAIRPESVFDKLGAFFGGGDINFESAEFSRRFHVTAEDRRWAYDVLHVRAIEFLMSRPMRSLQFEPRGVIIWGNGRFSAADYQSAVETVCGLLDGLPEYVIRDLQRMS